MTDSHHGDNVEAEVGKDGKGVAVGKNIQQDIQDNRAENIININLAKELDPPRQPRTRRPPDSGGLMPEVASEIWKTIAEMRESMGAFRQSLDNNSRATMEQSSSVKELSKTVDTSNQRNELAIIKMNEQIAALNRVANAIRSMGIQIPDNGHVEPGPEPSPWWREWIQPALITIGFAIIIFYLATGGHIP